MTRHFDKFQAFYQTASFWNGKLAGVQQFQLSNFDFSHLSSTDQSLELPNIPVDTVLGKRAEYFFRFCVEQSSNYELLAANEQIFRGKETLGELDYILKDLRRNKILHVELVYKFYIYEYVRTFSSPFLDQAENQELSHYLGPNRRDYFIKKFDYLVSRQLPLLHKPETQQRLKELGISVDNIEQQVCFLAHVFIPRELWRHRFPYLNKRCIVGYYLDEFAFAKAETDNIYFLPEKKEWKIKPQPLEQPYSYEEIAPLVQESLKRGFAPMLWMQLIDGSFERFFVVAGLS